MTKSKGTQNEEWFDEFINKFNTIIVNTAVVNNSILKLAEQLDAVYIMFGALKVSVGRLLKSKLDVSEEEFNKLFVGTYKEIMSGKTVLHDEYLMSVKELMQQHHELVEIIEAFRKNLKIAEA